MTRREFHRIAAAGLCARAGAAGRRPNILVILLDDMGYSDIGCFGGEIRTPHIDRLAAGGVRFTQFYNTARCCPSRASLLTGLYAHQAGVGHMEADWGLPAYQGHLKRDVATLPEMLREQGYRTIMAGKWHLGTAEPDLPWNRGFDRFYGIPQGGGVYFWPTPLKRDVVRFDRARGLVQTKPGPEFYSTDAFTDYAVEQIRESDGAFFMYAAYVAPHFPHQAWERDVRKYLGRYRAGWDRLRAERYRRQVASGIVDARHALAPSDAPAWESFSAAEQKQLDRQMAVYAAQMECVDRNVGRLVDALREKGILRDTLILFLSDNGAQRNGRLGSERNPSAVFGSRESFGEYAHGWASLCNTPFRRYKSEEHHGGNATPLIAHWPAAIAGGRIVQRVGHIIDIVPTCLEAAGVERQGFEGVSLLRREERARTLFWEHEGNRAMRSGDWKLVGLHGRAWELYDLSADRTELRDLAGAFPDRVRGMAAEYDRWTARCGVQPWPVVRR